MSTSTKVTMHIDHCTALPDENVYMRALSYLVLSLSLSLCAYGDRRGSMGPEAADVGGASAARRDRASRVDEDTGRWGAPVVVSSWSLVSSRMVSSAGSVGEIIPMSVSGSRVSRSSARALPSVSMSSGSM